MDAHSIVLGVVVALALGVGQLMLTTICPTVAFKNVCQLDLRELCWRRAVLRDGGPLKLEVTLGGVSE